MSALPKSQAAEQAADRPATVKFIPYSSIGDVMKKLKPEFEDLSVSKIRFLESEGLICPQRSQSGYRRFSPQDIVRLRYILTQQRDNYLPLKVIKEHLDAIDAGLVAPVGEYALGWGAEGDNEVTLKAEDFSAVPMGRMRRADISSLAKVDDAFTGSLVRLGLIEADSAGFFNSDDAAVVQMCYQLTQYGLDIRHLKALQTIANRQSDLVARVADPLSRHGDGQAQQRSIETAREVARLVMALNTALVKANLG